MKTILISSVLQICLLLCGAACAGGEEEGAEKSGGISAADRLGEEFQSRGPWSLKKEEGESPYVIPQPDAYTEPSQGEMSPEEEYRSPLCYNPGSGGYEYCYHLGSRHFRARFYSPEFRFWWNRGRSCPPGYFFSSGRGCVRK